MVSDGIGERGVAVYIRSFFDGLLNALVRAAAEKSAVRPASPWRSLVGVDTGGVRLGLKHDGPGMTLAQAVVGDQGFQRLNTWRASRRIPASGR